jgi:citrate synthase
MASWRSRIVQADAESIRIHGYSVVDLMRRASFVETIFLLQRGRLPSAGERKLLDALLVGIADHGSGAPSCAAARLVASGNRQSLSAAVAAGVLAIGDHHGGAGEAAMEMIAAAGKMMQNGQMTAALAAEKTIAEYRRRGTHLPGLGHRVHTSDPRVETVFGMAEAEGLAGIGIEFMRALEVAARAQIKPLPLNIDGALAAILFDLGFAPQAGMLIFLIGRVAGLAAEVAEEYERERPMRIRIDVEYDGEPPREIK